jgi:chromosome partitioning protein
MPVVTICNHKGGSGKTTTAVHVAAAFGRAGRRVLAIDLDPQGFLTRTLGIEEPPPERSALMLVDAEGRLDGLPLTVAGGFDVIPSSPAMTRAQRSLNRPTDVFLLRETLERGYDYELVLIDTAAAVSVYTMNALVASTHAVVPVTPEYQPVLGAEQTVSTCALVRDRLNPALGAPRLVLTQVDARKRTHAGFSRYVRENYYGDVLDTVVRTSAVLAESPGDGRTVFDTDLSSRGARDYACLADELSRLFFDPPAVAGGDGADVLAIESAAIGSEAP